MHQNDDPTAQYLAFMGPRVVAKGSLPQVALTLKALSAQSDIAPVQIFDFVHSHHVDVDLSGSPDEVVERLRQTFTSPPVKPTPATNQKPEARGRGRPKLGVVSREVTLMPRHWQWLNSQPGGASAALRRLVEQARRAQAPQDQLRAARDSAYRFMSAMAGDRTGFEEAARALFNYQAERFHALIQEWPEDIRAHLGQLATTAFTQHIALSTPAAPDASSTDA